MFSMEDRRRAVDLYFTEGMTIRKVIAELGYPSEGALVKWVREDPRYTGACRRSYTLECKTNAARRALEGEPLARVARDCVCSIESGPCERVDVFHVSGRFWSTSACGEKRTPARPAWTSFPS